MTTEREWFSVTAVVNHGGRTCSVTTPTSCFQRTPSDASPFVSFSARMRRARVVSVSRSSRDFSPAVASQMTCFASTAATTFASSACNPRSVQTCTAMYSQRYTTATLHTITRYNGDATPRYLLLCQVAVGGLQRCVHLLEPPLLRYDVTGNLAVLVDGVHPHAQRCAGDRHLAEVVNLHDGIGDVPVPSSNQTATAARNARNGDGRPHTNC